MSSEIVLESVSPLLIVRDVERAAEWYRDIFGLTIGDIFREDHGPHDGDDDHAQEGETVFVIVHGGGVEIMLQRAGTRPIPSNSAPNYPSSDIYIRVRGIDALYERARAAGATILQEMTLMFYGLREFQLADLDGYVVTVSSPP